MDLNTPVAFSIPSVHPSGETDAAGLCTIQLLNLLVNSQNEIIADVTGSEGEVTETNNNVQGSVISYKTPSKQIDQLIIHYDRSMLLDLIDIHTEQSLDLKRGTQLSFDWFLIDLGIQNQILAGKQHITLIQRHYQYRGEIATNRKLQSLGEIVPQCDLPEVVAIKIEAELDSQFKIASVSRYMESTINLLCSVGGGNLHGVLSHGKMSLYEFVTNTLSVSSQEFNTSVPPSVAKNIFLEHLVGLSQLIDELSNGDPSKRVSPKYLVPLTDELLATLQSIENSIDISIFLKTLKGFMIDQLVEGKWPENGSLKNYLSYFDFDLTEKEWFNLIPDNIELQYSSSVYQYFKMKQDGK